MFIVSESDRHDFTPWTQIRKGAVVIARAIAEPLTGGIEGDERHHQNAWGDNGRAGSWMERSEGPLFQRIAAAELAKDQHLALARDDRQRDASAGRRKNLERRTAIKFAAEGPIASYCFSGGSQRGGEPLRGGGGGRLGPRRMNLPPPLNNVASKRSLWIGRSIMWRAHWAHTHEPLVAITGIGVVPPPEESGAAEAVGLA